MLNEEMENEEVLDSNDRALQEFNEYEKKTLNQIYDEQAFKDIPETKDILGDFADRVLKRSMYIYNNRYLFNRKIL